MIMLLICLFGIASIVSIRGALDRIDERDFTGLFIYAVAAIGFSFILGLIIAIALAS